MKNLLVTIVNIIFTQNDNNFIFPTLLARSWMITLCIMIMKNDS